MELFIYLICYLFDSVLDFVEEEGIDDAWVVASYLSDADSLLASLNGIRSRSYEAENLIQSTAASVAVRGVMFGNRHPLSSRYSFNILIIVIIT